MTAVAAAAILARAAAFGLRTSGSCAFRRLHRHASFRPYGARATRLFSASSFAGRPPTPRSGSSDNDDDSVIDDFEDVLPLREGSHNSTKIVVAPVALEVDGEQEPVPSVDSFDKSTFRERLKSTIRACQELGKTSLWIEVPMCRAALIEDMEEFGLRFHHAEGTVAVLNVWLSETESKIPSFATHNVGVGAVVVNSRDEILCVRELRRNYFRWKTPTGISDLGERIDEAAEREVMEETGIRAKFHSILGFRQTHGLAHGRSDLFFVCRLDPVEEVDEDGNVVIPDPIAQECEIAEVAWVPLAEYKAMIATGDSSVTAATPTNGQPPTGHPMMEHVIEAFEAGRRIDSRVVTSVVPGRGPNHIFFPASE